MGENAAATTGPGAVSGEAKFDINDVFSLRRPKDAKAGLASGAKSVGKGFLAGAATLVAAPAVGALQEGALGFGKGLAAGVACAVVLPVAGVAVGVTQVVRGVAAQPAAITEQAAGKQWDQRMRQWVADPGTAVALQDDHTEAAHRQWGGAQRAGSRLQEADDFYALLGVPRDATAEHMKKQYYTQARALHPDKNPDDPGAKERFQKLGEAYQVLSDPAKRKRYDEGGVGGLGDNDFMDGALFFTALFGSERFHHLVGELAIATMARLGQVSSVQMAAAQEERAQMLTVMLTALLRRWVEGDEAGFREGMVAEAMMLVECSYGSLLLGAIGRAYVRQADKALGNIFERGAASLRANWHSMQSQVHVAKLALRVFAAQQDISRLDAQQQAQQAIAEAAASPAEDGTASTAQSAVQPDAQPGGTPSQQAPSQQRQHEAAGGGLGCTEAAAAAARAAAQDLLIARAAAEEAALPLMLDAMWAANVVDIEGVVARVCARVVGDSAASPEVRAARARGLRELGLIFKQTKPKEEQAASGSAINAKATMEAAMMRVVEQKFAEDDAAHNGER